MKIRQGFVSNSSSSSFVIRTDALTEEQIQNLWTLCEKPVGDFSDSWDLYVNDKTVSGFTSMRNNSPGENDGDIQDWMASKGFPMQKIKWECD